MAESQYPVQSHESENTDGHKDSVDPIHEFKLFHPFHAHLSINSVIEGSLSISFLPLIDGDQRLR